MTACSACSISTAPAHRSIRKRISSILLPVAKHIAVALENALLFEEISREKKEWERTFDAITDMVWIEDGRQQVIRANHTLLHADRLFQVGDRRTSTAASFSTSSGSRSTGCCLCAETLSCKRPSFQELKSARRQHLPLLGLSAHRRGGPALRHRPLSQGRDGPEADRTAAHPLGQARVARHARGGHRP